MTAIPIPTEIGRAPAENVQDAIAIVSPLVADGYLTTLRVSDWTQTRTAQPMATADALAVVLEEANYLPPEDAGGVFYLLSLTAKGEALMQSRRFAVQPG